MPINHLPASFTLRFTFRGVIVMKASVNGVDTDFCVLDTGCPGFSIHLKDGGILSPLKKEPDGLSVIDSLVDRHP